MPAAPPQPTASNENTARAAAAMALGSGTRVFLTCPWREFAKPMPATARRKAQKRIKDGNVTACAATKLEVVTVKFALAAP